MSAFLVSPKTIALIAKAIADNRPEFTDPALVAKELLAMNLDALKERYGDNVYDNPGSEYEYFNYDAPPIEICKRMHCYHYQCSEGNVPERPLFKEVEELIERYTYRITDELPDVQALTYDEKDSVIRELPEWAMVPWE